MANIPVEHKEGRSWLGWLIGLLLLAGVIWLLVEAFDDDPETLGPDDPTTEVMPGGVSEPYGSEGTTGEGTAGIGAILASPSAYVGESFPAGEVDVAEVPTDRGFWIEEGGQRLFAILIDQPQEEPLDINPDQRLRIEDGTLRDASYLSEIQGVPLDEDTRRIAEQQEVFLVVDESNLAIVEGDGLESGTARAEPQP